jgi:hypothetical protein
MELTLQGIGLGALLRQQRDGHAARPEAGLGQPLDHWGAGGGSRVGVGAKGDRIVAGGGCQRSWPVHLPVPDFCPTNLLPVDSGL